MALTLQTPKQAVQYDLRVDAAGRLEIPSLGLPEGTPVEVILIIGDSDAADLATLRASSETSLSFWDNPIDDETWNDF